MFDVSDAGQVAWFRLVQTIVIRSVQELAAMGGIPNLFLCLSFWGLAARIGKDMEQQESDWASIY